MSGIQRVIKYLALAFAIYLIVNIASGIMYGIKVLDGFDHSEHNSKVQGEIKHLGEFQNSNILDIDVTSSNIIVKESDVFKIDSTNKYIECKQDHSKISIKEKNHNWFNTKDEQVIIYIPHELVFDGVSIHAGAGKIEIASLSTKNLFLDLGAGKVLIDHLFVSNNAEINGGVGEVIIQEGIIHNALLDLGIGKFYAKATLTGNTNIDHGIGKVDLDLIGSTQDYQIHVDKGIGSIKVDNKNIGDNQTVGNGINKIDIDGGIGSIHVSFIDVKSDK